MIAEKLLELPAWITVKQTDRNREGVFHLSLFKNHSNELRICYSLDDREDPISLPWDPETTRDWILLIENIANDIDIVDAVNWILHELIAITGYIENPFHNTLTHR